MTERARFAAPFASACLTLALSATLGLAADGDVDNPPDAWPQFRGPGGKANVDGRDLTLPWDESDLLWKTSIEGTGHSSPVVWGSRIFLTTAIEGEPIEGHEAPKHVLGGEEFVHPQWVAANLRHTMKVLAVDAKSGAILWSRTAYEGPVFDHRHKASSYASPTPITDGERVYAYFGSEGLYAYDFGGELAWKRDIGDIRTIGMGVGSSPVLFDGLLIVQADEDEGEESFLLALDARTGEQAWKVPRPVQASWTTPLLVEHDGHTQLLANGNEFLISYDPKTGEEIWRTKGLESNAIHVPLVHENIAIFTAGYPAKVVVAADLDWQGDHSQEAEVVWRYNKGTAYVPTNLLHDGLLYLMNDTGVLTCLDAKTGEVLYEGGRPGSAGRFMASPLAIGDRILQISQDGDASVIKAGRQHEVLGTVSLDEPVYATPAIADGKMYVRGQTHLFAIDLSGS